MTTGDNLRHSADLMAYETALADLRQAVVAAESTAVAFRRGKASLRDVGRSYRSIARHDAAVTRTYFPLLTAEMETFAERAEASA